MVSRVKQTPSGQSETVACSTHYRMRDPTLKPLSGKAYHLQVQSHALDQKPQAQSSRTDPHPKQTHEHHPKPSLPPVYYQIHPSSTSTPAPRHHHCFHGKTQARAPNHFFNFSTSFLSPSHQTSFPPHKKKAAHEYSSLAHEQTKNKVLSQSRLFVPWRVL